MSLAAGRAASNSVLSIKACAVLLSAALMMSGASVHANGEPVYFHVVRVPTADAAADAFAASREDETASFAAFMPLPDAARIRAQLASLDDRGEQYSPQYAELAEQLGRVLQAQGEHREALAAFDRSFHVNRRQEGLYSPMQAALLRAQIDSQLALGDSEAVDRLQHALFAMQQELLAGDSAALADALREAADWNMQYYLQAQQSIVPGGITQAEQHARAERLGTALGQYHRALGLLTVAAPTTSPAARASIERRIAAVMRISDRQHQLAASSMLSKPGLANLHQHKRSHNPVLFAHGSAALQRAVDYTAGSDEPMQRAARQLELADWYLLMDQHDLAGEVYSEAMATLRAANLPEQQVAEFVESGLPAHDPERELRSLAQPDASEFDGYVDVAFDLDRYGRAHNARVPASAAGDTAYDAALEDALLREVRSTRFRPVFRDDIPAASKDLTLRYYFAR
ncbi:MAG: hypothetical protein ACO1PZ_12345 [Gammaproteobacteria bacterium]